MSNTTPPFQPRSAAALRKFYRSGEVSPAEVACAIPAATAGQRYCLGQLECAGATVEFMEPLLTRKMLEGRDHTWPLPPTTNRRMPGRA